MALGVVDAVMFVTLESLAKRTRRYVRVLKYVVVESKLERGVHFRLMYLVRLCSVQKISFIVLALQKARDSSLQRTSVW